MNKIIEAAKVCLSPYGLLVISALFLFFGRVVFKKKYLNCFDIIKKHLECFKSSNGKYEKISIIMYFGVPFLMALSLVRIKEIEENIVNILTIIISILTSMLFTLLTLILDMRKNVLVDTSYDANNASVSAKLLKETYYSIMFEIMLSVVILILCFVELFSSRFTFCASIIIYYFSFVLLMNLFMVLKRIFNVIDNDIRVRDRRN